MNLEIREPIPTLDPVEALRRWRDELPHRVADLPWLESLQEKKREHEEGHVERQIIFSLDVQLPPLARPFLPRETLILELAERFRIEAGTWALHSQGVSKEAAAAHGTLHFLPGDGGSVLVAEGSLHLDWDALPHLPGFLIRSMGPSLEKGMARGIEKAFARLAKVLVAPGWG